MSDISVVIPLYNKELHIARAISSVLTQSITTFELIIIDDGSTDNSRHVAESFQDRRIKIVSQKNKGVSAARNAGIRFSSADLIAFLDADDEWKPSFLNTVLSIRYKYPLAGAYGTLYEIKLPNGGKHTPMFNGINENWEGILPSYFRASMGLHVLHTSATAIPKSVFSEIGGFKVGEKLGEDLDMWLRIALNYPIAYSCKIPPKVIYHQDSENRTHFLPVSVEKLPYLITAENAVRSGNIGHNTKHEIIEYIASRKIGYAKLSILRGNRKEGRALLSSINTNIFQSTKNIWYFLSFLPTFLFDFGRYAKRILLSLMRSRRN